MTRNLRAAVAASALLVAMSAGGTAFAQKQGGVLRMYTPTARRACRSTRKRRSSPRADDGGVQQSGHVRPACDAEQPRSRSCPIWRPAGRGTRTGPS